MFPVKYNLKFIIYFMMRQFCIVIWGCSFLVSVQHKKVAHHAIWLHSRSCVHRVPKQTIPGHFQTHHPCHHHSRVNACVKTNKKEFSWSIKSLKCVNQVLTLCGMHINYEYIKNKSDERVAVLLCDTVWIRVHLPTRIWMLSPVEGSFRWSMELNISRAMSQMWWAWNVVLLGTPATTI